MKRYGLKGVNDEATECSICGKVELKRVMWLVSLDAEGTEDGEPFPCGTTCGAKLLGYTVARMTKEAKDYAYKVWVRRQALERQHPSSIKAAALIQELRGIYGDARREDPRYAEAKALLAEAKAWAADQDIVIDL